MRIITVFEELDLLLSNKYIAWLLTVFFALAGTVMAFKFNGTCDDGDSVMHYQFARWAVKHPELYFHHWAKPLFVLIASPAAQFGIQGIKLFNLLLSTLCLLNTYRIARHLKVERKALAVALLIAMPAFIIHSLSGLTEPLFALALSTGILLYLKNRYVPACLIISFLPFVRSEGLIICGVFSFMLMLERKWLLLPLLAVGHVVYSIAGLYYHDTLWWVFTKIPYARMSSFYGKGTWQHFFVNLPFIIGIPVYFLLGAGVVHGFIKALIPGSFKIHRRELVLVYGSFGAYFLGHVCFWALGIFNSFGLMRVLVGVLPLMAIVSLRGLNLLVQYIPNTLLRTAVLLAILAWVAVFPLTKSVYGFDKQRDFALSAAQQAQDDVAAYIKATYPKYKSARFYYDANYMAVALDIDYFDGNVSRRIWEDYSAMPRPGDFAVWDDYYAGMEYQTPISHLENDGRFDYVKTFSRWDPWGNEKKFTLFMANQKASP